MIFSLFANTPVMWSTKWRGISHPLAVIAVHVSRSPSLYEHSDCSLWCQDFMSEILAFDIGIEYASHMARILSIRRINVQRASRTLSLSQHILWSAPIAPTPKQYKGLQCTSTLVIRDISKRCPSHQARTSITWEIFQCFRRGAWLHVNSAQI